MIDIRILADLHLGALDKNLENENLEILLDSVRQGSIAKYSIILGDLFESPNILTRHSTSWNVLEKASKLLKVLAARTKHKVFILKGNHDALENDDFLGLINLIDNESEKFVIINKPAQIETSLLLNGDPLYFLFYPWVRKEFDRSVFHNEKYGNSIMFAHGIYPGCHFFSNKGFKIDLTETNKEYSYNTFEAVELDGLQYSFFGHTHFRHTEDNFTNVGQAWNTKFHPSRDQQAKALPGYCYYNVTEFQPKFVDLETKRFFKCWSKEDLDQVKDIKNVKPMVVFQMEDPPEECIYKPIIEEEVRENEKTLSIDEVNTPVLIWKKWCTDKGLDDFEEGLRLLPPYSSTTTFDNQITKIKSIELKNIGPQRAIKLELSKNITGLIGQNGTGKTFILESVALALYGNSAFRKSHCLNRQSKTGYIKLELETKLGLVEIARGFKRKADSISTVLKIKIDGKEVELTKIKDLQQMLDMKFGPFISLCSINYFSQNRSGSILLSQAERKKVLADLFKLTIFDACEIHIKKQISTNKIRIEEQTNSVKNLTEQLEKQKALDIAKLPNREKIELENKENNKKLYKQIQELDELIKLENALSNCSLENLKTFCVPRKQAENKQQQLIQEGRKLKTLKLNPKDDCEYCNTYKATITNRQKYLRKEYDEASKNIAEAILYETYENLLPKIKKYFSYQFTNDTIKKDVILKSIVTLVDNLKKSIKVLENKTQKATKLLNDHKAEALAQTMSSKNLESLLTRNQTILDATEKNQAILKKLAVCFGPKGLKNKVIGIETINAEISKYCSKIDGEFHFRLERDEKNINVIVRTKNGTGDSSECSAGELLLVDLLFRISCINVLNHHKFLVVDEIFDSLDELRKREVLDIIKDLDLQILCSSHDKELIHELDTIVMVDTK